MSIKFDVLKDYQYGLIGRSRKNVMFGFIERVQDAVMVRVFGW